jgi:uncharacterized membrane-anchored protein YitT (DUF2179 family)
MAKKSIAAAGKRLHVQDIVFITLGALMATIGLRGFLLPNHFLDGGVTGISLIIQAITGLPLSALLVVLNVPFIFMGWRQVSRFFALKTLWGISVLAAAVAVLNVPVLTTDPLLIAVFGGFFIGLGIGLAIRGGGVKHLPVTVGDVILAINIVIFSTALWVFNIETALYAILTYLCAAKTVDFVLHGLEEYVAMQIFSNNPALLYKILSRNLHLKMTMMRTMKGNPSRPETMVEAPLLYTIVSRLEAQNVIRTVHNLDPEAVVIHHKITDVERGSGLQDIA